MPDPPGVERGVGGVAQMPLRREAWTMRKLAIGLTAMALAIAGVGGIHVDRVAASAVQPKVVLVVGATGGTTASYRSIADSAANVFAKYTSNIVKVYSPNATWPAVQAAAQGASVLVYLGHGTGFPNPYVGYFQPNGDNGMGLNASATGSDSNTYYYGENYMAQLGLAWNSVVILNHLCYASGNNEWGAGNPSLATAQTRIDGYGAGFLRGNARAVIAEGLGDIGWYIDQLFTANRTIDSMWKAYPGNHGNFSNWASTRNPGFTSQMDPNTTPAGDGDIYYRSMVSLPGFSTTDLGKAPAPITYTPTTYHPVTPARILDTRTGAGIVGAIGVHNARTFQVTGQGGVPAGATAVTGNLTVTGQNSIGFLYIGPTPNDYPTSSTLNFPVGDDRANAVTVGLSSLGTLSVTYAAPSTGPIAHVIFDVTGYFTPDTSGATYLPLAPTRLLDTRSGNGFTGPLAVHQAQTFQVTGRGGVPAGASAVTGNLTVTGQTSNGNIYLGPTATDNPTSSTLNFPPGDDRANSVTVALSSTGTLSVTFVAPTAGQSTQALFDVTGYFLNGTSGATYMPLGPTRLLDSRDGTGLSGAFSSHVGRSFQVTGKGGIPAGATAVTGNLTVTGQTSVGYLFAGPAQVNDPTSSTLNFPLNDDRANAVTVALASSGTLSITYAAPSLGPTANAVFDVTGYFAK
jgi:hypothetical protein